MKIISKRGRVKNPQLKKAYATDEYTPNMIQELAKCKKPTKNKDRIYDTRPRYFTYMYADILSGNPFYIGKGCGKRHLDHLSSKEPPLGYLKGNPKLKGKAGGAGKKWWYDPISLENKCFLPGFEPLHWVPGKLSAKKKRGPRK